MKISEVMSTPLKRRKSKPLAIRNAREIAACTKPRFIEIPSEKRSRVASTEALTSPLPDASAASTSGSR